ncbi:MAG TPA: T9SS type A sorting domain-containing protein [Candidatus Kapabacteria bacterium]|jgi:hypothetical protein|nr:T9SS type A sorting domain-containing protein [Candidatus Kapabacteria bacterium]
MIRIGTALLIFFSFITVSAQGQVLNTPRHFVKPNPALVTNTNRGGTIPISTPSQAGQPLATQIDSVFYYGDTSNGNIWVYVPVLDQASGDSLGYYGVSQDGSVYFQNEDTIGPTEFKYINAQNVTIDTMPFDTMYNRIMAIRVSTPTDITSPRLIGADLTIFPISFNATDVLHFAVVPITDAQFGDNNFYPIPQIFGTPLATTTVSASNITVGQLNTIHVNFSKILYSGKKITYPQFAICVYVDGPNFITDTVGYVLDQNLNNLITSSLSIDTDGSLGTTGEPMRTYQLNLDAGNLSIGGTHSPVGGGGGFFINFAQLDPTTGQQTGGGYDGNLMLTTYFSGTSAGVANGTANQYNLEPCYPNPVVSTSAEIPYNLGNSGPATLKVYNAIGEEIATVVNGFQASGPHSATFNVSHLPNGMYYYKLQSGDYSATQSMVVNK